MMDPTIAEVVFSLLQERYAQGRKDGYDKAMAELKDALAAIEVPLPATALSATAWPVVEPKAAKTAAADQSCRPTPPNSRRGASKSEPLSS